MIKEYDQYSLRPQTEDEKKSILLTYCWGNTNVGDKVITPGMLNLLKESFPRANVTLVSLFSKADPQFQESSIYIKEHYPNINFLPSNSLFPFFNIKYVGKFLNVVNLFFLFLFPKFYSNFFPEMTGFKYLIKSDLVISNCSHSFFWNSRMKSIWYTFFRAYPLIMAKRLRINYGFYAQSFGPFEFNYFEGIIKIFFKQLFSGSCFIFTRENESISIIDDFGIKMKGSLKKVPDAAFSFTGEDNQESNNILEKYNLEPEMFITMTVRLTKRGSAEYLENDLYKEYSTKLTEFMSDWIASNKIPILMVCQVPHDIEDSMYIYENLPEEYKKYCFVMTEKLSPEALRSLYRNSRFLIGMRFHSLIFALSECTPVIGLYYYDIGPKILGIMRDFGFQDYVFDINDISRENFFERTNELNQNRAKVSKEIEQKLACLKEEGSKAMKEIGERYVYVGSLK